MIGCTQDLVFSLWTRRNKILHATNNAVTCDQANEIHLRIDTVFATRPPRQLMERADSLYFRKHLAAMVKSLNMEQKRRWVEGAEIILKNFEATQNKQAKQLQSYFQWNPG